MAHIRYSINIYRWLEGRKKRRKEGKKERGKEQRKEEGKKGFGVGRSSQ